MAYLERSYIQRRSDFLNHIENKRNLFLPWVSSSPQYWRGAGQSEQARTAREGQPALIAHYLR